MIWIFDLKETPLELRSLQDSPHIADVGMGLRVKADMPRHTGKLKMSVRRRRHNEL